MLPKTMKAVTILGQGVLEIQKTALPEPGPGDLLIKVKAATTCGTDLKIYRRGHPKFPPPFVFGHEFGGDIVAVGSDVPGFEIGMPVTANVFGECGQCFYCLKGQGNLCENLDYNFGAFAEYHLVPASIVRENTFVIPPNISYAEAAIVEPLISVVHAADLVKIKPGERVAVLGAGGPISLLFIQLIRLAGAEEIIAIGHSDTRLSMAKKLGADILVNARREDPSSVILERTAGHGADAVIECAGQLETWVSSVELVRKGGSVLWFGGLPSGTKVPVEATKVHYGEILLINSHGGTAKDAAVAFDLISSGKINTNQLITHKMPLDEVHQALELMAGGEAIKVALIP